jgi:PhzF family phenazine biosynthesis protein
LTPVLSGPHDPGRAPDSFDRTGGADARAGLRLPYRVVDAFTDTPFTGNPAAVVLPGPWTRALSDAQLQVVAAEMNLSETAFPHPPEEDGARRLRWFTPTTEVTLCGHATLATAHALLEEGATPPLRFDSLSGSLVVDRDAGGRLRLDFPADPPREMPPPDGLMAALGLPPHTPFLAGHRSSLVPVESEARLLDLDPDPGLLGRVRLPSGVMGVSPTAPADEPGVDFVSRFFGPWVGVPEDPVTGMAHTVLGPYWGERLGKGELEARQRSRRGGALRLRLAGDRVHLLGRGVTVARGELIFPP